jgi:hypothetical protein
MEKAKLKELHWGPRAEKHTISTAYIDQFGYTCRYAKDSQEI